MISSRKALANMVSVTKLDLSRKIGNHPL